jgi:hypothetical protein
METMLWDISAIHGFAIEATDGQLGTVSDVLFGDSDWVVRWLVVDTGKWLPGRLVLLPISALGKPDPARRQFPVKLTKQQIRTSPDIATDQPVSRQVESYVYDYYGWPPYWGTGSFGMDAIATPLVAPILPMSRSDDAGVPPNEGDPHLRSFAAVTGYHVHAVDGEIGHAEDFLVDDVSWNVRYIVVDTNNWWAGERVLVSPRAVLGIEWSDGLINLNVLRENVKSGTRYNHSISLDRAYAADVLTRYGTHAIAGGK